MNDIQNKHPEIKPHTFFHFILNEKTETLLTLMLETYRLPGTQEYIKRSKISIREGNMERLIMLDSAYLNTLINLFGSVDVAIVKDSGKKSFHKTEEGIRVDLTPKQVWITFNCIKVLMISELNQHTVDKLNSLLVEIKETQTAWIEEGVVITPPSYEKEIRKPHLYYNNCFADFNCGSLESSFSYMSVLMKSYSVNDVRNHNFVLRMGKNTLCVRDSYIAEGTYFTKKSILIEEFITGVLHCLQRLLKYIADDNTIDKNYYEFYKVDQTLLVGTDHFNASVKVKDHNTYAALVRNEWDSHYMIVISSDLLNPFGKISITTKYSSVEEVIDLLQGALKNLTA